MRRNQLSLGLTILAGIALGGCGSTPTAPTETPTSAPAPAATVGAAPTMVTPPKPADLTHVLTKDEPYYASEPTPGAPPSGTLKSGSKVLVLIPGATYSQVVSDTGVQAYTETDGLKPLGK